jgi:hypothetical protein
MTAPERDQCTRHLRRLKEQGWTRDMLITEAAQWIADYGAPQTNGGDELSATQLVACVDPPTRRDFYGFGSSVERVSV